MSFMEDWSRHHSPDDEEDQWTDAGIDDILECCDSFDLCKWIGYGVVAQAEKSFEGDQQ